MIIALSLPQSSAAVAVVSPFIVDHEVASWFHAHLNWTFVHILRLLSEPGSSSWIGLVLVFAVGFFLWKRAWPALVTLVVAVPGGMLLNELVKIAVQRHRPYIDGPFVDWSGYSFASGHTIGATLLYGQLALFLLPIIKSRQAQRVLFCSAGTIVLLVGFSRIALGAHYLTDVLAAMCLGTLWLKFCLLASKRIQRDPVSMLDSVTPPILPAEAAVPAPASIANQGRVL